VRFENNAVIVYTDNIHDLSPPRSMEVEGWAFFFYAVGRGNFPAYEGVYLDPAEARLEAASPTGQTMRIFEDQASAERWVQEQQAERHLRTTGLDSPGPRILRVTLDPREEPGVAGVSRDNPMVGPDQ
jgi:hypothetical protein